MRFSQRKGLTPAKKTVQIDSLDDELRNGLWSALQLRVWDKYISGFSNSSVTRNSNLGQLFLLYWHEYFKQPIDTMPDRFQEARDFVRKYFFECEWYEVYDFIEFTARHFPQHLEAGRFIVFCNSVLERENSGYRFVENTITQITSAQEIESIEEAIESAEVFSGVQIHINAALEHLSRRKNPDYRNSIKESISAVEAICQLISGNSKATLGKALKVLEKREVLHESLQKAFSSLYSYTSDADGIRHAMLEQSNVSYVDAKFMLVVCASFTNYMIGKAAELGIEVKKMSD